MYADAKYDHEFLIIGSGFSGLGAAIALRRSGRDDLVILERADAIGGTWRDNTYPGCGCDVPTPLYSYSFAPNPEWSHFFARQEEIRAYIEDCADRFDVRRYVRLDTEVIATEWEEDEQRWRVSLADGEQLTARFVIAGLGGLTRPAYPEIAGLDEFEGPVMHSAAWDHSVEIEGRRLAVIGTGASSIQLTPEVAKVAAHVDVFQRTPPWVFPKMDITFGRLAKAMFRRLPLTQRLLRAAVFWFSESIAYPLTKRPALTKLLELYSRLHLRLSVPDADLRAQLTPNYRAGCKRMLPSNDYWRSLTRANVDLVSSPIERVTPTGVLCADGSERGADVLICSTGFDIAGHVAEVEVRGRGGLTTAEAWADGFTAHRGTMVSGFPNFFMLAGPNTGTGSTSQIYMVEAQIEYVMRALDELDRRGAVVVEARADAQRAYNEWIDAQMQRTVWLSGCGSWYLDESGKNRVLYPDFSSRFRSSTRRFRPEEHLIEPVRAPDQGPAPVRGS